MIILYHGTSSKRASKIVGNNISQQQGFKITDRDSIFLAEDLHTARFFATEKVLDAISEAVNTGNPDSPKYVTVIEFAIPTSVANELEIADCHRKLLGEFTDMTFPDIFDGTGFERILIGESNISAFNKSLACGDIKYKRLKFRMLNDMFSD